MKWLYELYLKWKYRSRSDDECCCGSLIGQGGEICYHGGCRSLKEYCITTDVERVFPNE